MSIRVRWQQFSGWSRWIECSRVESGPADILKIHIDGWRSVWVPLHVVRGEIQIEDINAPREDK